MSSQRRNSELAQLARIHRVSSEVTEEAIYNFLCGLDCPESLKVWLLYKTGEHEQLADLDLNPMHYANVWKFRDAYTAYAFLSKASFLKLAVSKKDAAFKKFFEFEELCKQTNARFRNLALDPNYHGPNVWLLNATIRKIDKILGEFTPDEWVESANWGPGVTTLLKGSHVSAVNKFHSENGITRDLHALVGDLFPVAYPLWWSHLTSDSKEPFQMQLGNSIVTVPKNSKTDRVIAVEPGINLWFQKGIGTMIRRRLRRWGVDLNSQTENQRLARVGAKHNTLATVDFSSASDSISKELVRELLPPQWYFLLNACRSPLGVHSGTLIRWEKFSSMGNGFTFELESLIFYAAALAVREYLGVEGEVSVFGDDVILPRDCYDLFSSFSAFLGFRVNPKKSFSSTHFRESCGAHWFGGVDCKPIFLKERLHDVSSIYKLANSVRWLAHRRNSHYGCDHRFRHTVRRLEQRVPKPLRFRISAGQGDGGFISNFDEACPARASGGIEGFYVSSLVETGITQYHEGVALLLARLKGQSSQPAWVTRPVRDPTRCGARIFIAGEISDERLEDRADGNLYTLRGRTKLRVTRQLVRRWCNLGPWC